MEYSRLSHILKLENETIGLKKSLKPYIEEEQTCFDSNSLSGFQNGLQWIINHAVVFNIYNSLVIQLNRLFTFKTNSTVNKYNTYYSMFKITSILRKTTPEIYQNVS
jgi:hypothetical protein